MKKKILFIVALFCLFLGKIDAYSGTGTSDDPFVIKEGESISVDNCLQTYVIKTAAYKDNISLIQYDKTNHKCLITGLKASDTKHNVEVGSVSVASNVKYVKVVENTDTGRTPQNFIKVLGRYNGGFSAKEFITQEKIDTIRGTTAFQNATTKQNNQTFIISAAFYNNKFYINYGYGSDTYTFNYPALFVLDYNASGQYVSYDSTGTQTVQKEVETYLTRMFFYWKYEASKETEIVDYLLTKDFAWLENYVKANTIFGTWGNTSSEQVRVNFNYVTSCAPKLTGSYELTLQFNSNGGTTVDNKTVIVVGSNINDGKLSSPTKDGYIFGGWYADEALTKEIGTELTKDNIGNLSKSDNSTKTLASDCLTSDDAQKATLYAKWVDDGSNHGAVDPESEENDNPNTGATITFIAFMGIMLAFIVLLSKNNKKIYKI